MPSAAKQQDWRRFAYRPMRSHVLIETLLNHLAAGTGCVQEFEIGHQGSSSFAPRSRG